MLLLRDDGSLQVFAQEPAPPAGVSAADRQQKQLARAAERAAERAAAVARLSGAGSESYSRSGSGSGYSSGGSLSSLSAAAAAAEDDVTTPAPTFPLEFFERTVCVTAEARFGGAPVQV